MATRTKSAYVDYLRVFPSPRHRVLELASQFSHLTLRLFSASHQNSFRLISDISNQVRENTPIKFSGANQIMKLNQLAGLGFASIVVLASVGSTLIHPSPTLANHPTVHAKAMNKTVLASGNFVNQEKSTRGMAKIVSIDGKRYLEFDRNFSTGDGPDVKVILHRQSNVPLNIRERDYVTLSRIKSFKGAQRYAIPNNINLKDFKAVGIWCQQFNATFGYAPLVSM